MLTNKTITLDHWCKNEESIEKTTIYDNSIYAYGKKITTNKFMKNNIIIKRNHKENKSSPIYGLPNLNIDKTLFENIEDINFDFTDDIKYIVEDKKYESILSEDIKIKDNDGLCFIEYGKTQL